MGSPASSVPDPTLYLFDGYNLLHASSYADVRQLIDRLASFVAQQGARGIVVFDGHGDDLDRGPLQVRFVSDADTLIERLAAEHRNSEQVCLVSSDLAVRGTSGVEVRKLSSNTFLRDLGSIDHQEPAPLRLSERLDDETRAKLEKLRRGQET